tara:strand:+ start:345 stop:1115 length:771 start_codon:yes stop_codon:yes gene_type:complete
MISCHLQGGLGNYMFQIATTCSIAKDNNSKPIFNDKKYLKVHKNIDTYKTNILRNINFDSNFKYDKIYYEPFFNYSPIRFSENLMLYGYFQSEKYFKHNRKLILDIFSPTLEIITKIENKYNLIDFKKSCSIHIRRGDYLKLQNHHPPCDMEYYKNAMNRMPNNTDYLIFSDDIKWCKENFIGDQFTFIENETDVIDLHLMSLCKHNIIANSSFSWWGAWLNNNEEKIVVAPLKWFGPSKGDIITKDLYSEKWIKI